MGIPSLADQSGKQPKPIIRAAVLILKATMVSVLMSFSVLFGSVSVLAGVILIISELWSNGIG